MVYVVVLLGSLLGLSLMLGIRVALRHRAMRVFVRGIKDRSRSAQAKNLQVDDRPVQREPQSSRTTARIIQEVRSLQRRAEKAVARRRYDEAERFYISALTIDPDACEVQEDLAKLYLTTGRLQKAEALFREVLHTEATAESFGYLGQTLYELGQFSEACDAYSEALDRDPTNPHRQYSFGRAAKAAGDFEAAAQFLEKASARLSRDTELLRMLADCFDHLGYRDHAEETYHRINRLEPYDEEIKERLVHLRSSSAAVS